MLELQKAAKKLWTGVLHLFGIRSRERHPTAVALQALTTVRRPPLELVLPQRLPDKYVSLEIPACPRFERNDHDMFDSYEHYRPESGYWHLLLFVGLATAIIIALWAYLSHWFHRGTSATAQRGWTMAWLICGLVIGVLCAVLHRPLDMEDSRGRVPNSRAERDGSSKDPNEFEEVVQIGPYWQILILLITYCAPAIGGFVVVGQMYGQYGKCTSA
ncbi:hypothetical protein C8J57DRAFT_1509581 [Mycena rebaudengoi]|nr:hypothetical protein C8J57DRAFT_1509581 [Mycena rebaudengoi]